MAKYFRSGMSKKDKVSEARTIIGERLRSFRIRNNLYQREVADMINISSSTMSQIERGKLDIKASALPILADEYDVVVEAFYRDNDFSSNLLSYLVQMSSVSEDKKDTVFKWISQKTSKINYASKADFMLKMLCFSTSLATDYDEPEMQLYNKLDCVRGRSVESTIELLDRKE